MKFVHYRKVLGVSRKKKSIFQLMGGVYTIVTG